MNVHFDARNETDVVHVSEMPNIGSDELLLIIDYANRDWLRPAVIKYKSSFVAVSRVYDMTSKIRPLRIWHVIVQIPDHAWTAEEPWFSKFTAMCGPGDLRGGLIRAFEFIDSAEERNYNLHGLIG